MSSINNVDNSQTLNGLSEIEIIPLKHNAKVLPHYNTAILRPVDDLFAVEDLDLIQPEFEKLLSKAVIRNKNLRLEYDFLDKDEKRLDRNLKLADKCQSIGKRKRDDRKSTKISPLKRPKQKTSLSTSPPEGKLNDDGLSYKPPFSLQKEHRMVLSKNDIPNKFWLSVEPFCMFLTHEDVKMLDDLLEQYSGPLVPPIPNFGQLYPQNWSSEDIIDNKDLSRKSYLLKKTENLLGKCISGPLTQRLVTSFLEETLIDGDIEKKTKTPSINLSNMQQSSFCLKNGIDVERRLKSELVKQGILDVKEVNRNDEDEILSEIKKLVLELSSVSDYNANALKEIRKAAIIEIKRIELKRKLDTIDHKILEFFKKGTVLKRSIYSDDQQDILKLISEHKMLTEQIQKYDAE